MLAIDTLTLPSTWHETNFRKKPPLGPSEIWLGKKLGVYPLVFIDGETLVEGI